VNKCGEERIIGVQVVGSGIRKGRHLETRTRRSYSRAQARQERMTGLIHE
jgi:hypothetical protein